MTTPPNPQNPVNEYEVNGAIFIHIQSPVFTCVHGLGPVYRRRLYLITTTNYTLSPVITGYHRVVITVIIGYGA